MGKITTLFEDSAKTVELYPRTKTSAVSDADGNLLGDVAVYKAITVGTGVNPVSIMGVSEKLWENASPTTAFSNQTISIPLSNYRFVIVMYRVSISDTQYACSIAQRAGYDMRLFGYTNSGYFKRTYTPTSTGITFYACTDSSGTTNNNYLVPFRIWGIK